jgi:hypothetical protein
VPNAVYGNRYRQCTYSDKLAVCIQILIYFWSPKKIFTQNIWYQYQYSWEPTPVCD